MPITMSPWSRRSPVGRALAAMGVASALAMGAASPANAFGTIGELAEHERITRAALGCGANNAVADCLQPVSLDQVAGKRGTFGAVGSPDNPLTGEIFTSAAHCDNADYLAAHEYRPQDRERATTALLDCVRHARDMVRQAVQRAADLLDRQDRIKARQVSLGSDCSFNRIPGRVKCDVFESFGRALHAVQDFYSHSNWTDRAPDGPVTEHHPPGLGHDGISPLFALFGPEPGAGNVDDRLTTGCFDALAAGSGERLGCTERGNTRIKHAWLNKDAGVIDPVTGATSCHHHGRNVCTARGQVDENFAHAVSGAIADSRRQWTDLMANVRQTYPGVRGDRIVCALTHDDPTTTCH